MNRFKLCVMVVVFFLPATVLSFYGCAGTAAQPEAAPAPDQCVSPKNLEQDVAPEAQLESLTCSFKTYEGVETLHMKVTLKNTSAAPQRYKVNIFLDNGKAMGGLIPTAVKQGLVEPGATASYEYPFLQMQEKPKSVLLRIAVSQP